MPFHNRTAPRRQTVWVRTSVRQLNNAGFVQDILQPFRVDELGLIKSLPGTTITRVIGNLSLRVVSVDDSFTRYIYGLIVGDIENPPTVVNNPSASPGMDWMWVHQEAVVQERQEGTPTQNLVVAHYFMNLKSQRKLDVGETLFLVTDNLDGDNFDVVGQLNVLLKLA